MSMESYQTQTLIHINSKLTNDDSNEEALKILSNLLPTFGQKTFSESSTNENTQDAILLLLGAIDSMLIYSQPSYTLLSYAEHPVHVLKPCLSMNQNMDSCSQDFILILGLKITCTTST